MDGNTKENEMKREKTAYKNNGIRRSPRHAFIFQVPGQKPAKVWATVKPGRLDFAIILTEADVLAAMRLKGYGDGQNCAGAVCTSRHSDVFPHPVSGHFDWVYNRVYVADRNDALGLPKNCVVYAHNNSSIAKLFDNKAGLKKLLARLRKYGPITIKLSPPVYRPREEGRARGRQDAPPRRKAGAGGLKLRMTKWKSGWLKEAAA
jgi:hypothetical protein